MTRREVLGLAAAAFVMAPSSGPRWGAVTLERHRVLANRGVHLHVFYDGVDVTRRCQFADDTGAGTAHLLTLGPNGKPYIDRLSGGVARDIVHGITIRVGEPL
jgi:hypothetical protein